ncbi:hypothetical protein BV898_11428 [Hypsibius exemplaris]|uniref:PARP catalytic domain-containing protein n=1 Tax=Hypsibius exemplaris TaxID=2072580 RepID=A0A1W0WGX3_HYPEX|nr:hypothetical protein BV898_11428 [Hypsibius exemplaris]
MPNPKEAVVTPDGIEIPLGHSVKSGVKNTSLLYNEYIVFITRLKSTCANLLKGQIQLCQIGSVIVCLITEAV